MYRTCLGLLLLMIHPSCWQESAKQELVRIQLEDGSVIALYDNKEWDYVRDEPVRLGLYGPQAEDQSSLRPGIAASEKTIARALDMKSQGWHYIMPRPKSEGASWKQRDGRTTWYYGYWYNHNTYEFSKNQPVRSNDGSYRGDLINMQDEWRTGGRPRNPTELEWLLSGEGGIKPN